MEIFLLSLGAILLLMVIGVPVAFALGTVAAGMLFMFDYPLRLVPHLMTTGVDVFVLLAIPFFVLTGQLMNLANLTDRIFSFADSAVGHIPGGLGHVNISASMIFAGVSGAALADVQGLGTVEIKAMTDAGYKRGFSAAITAASSTIGPILPPSIPLVIYGVIAEVSIGELFVAGFLPGILMGLTMMVLVYFLALRTEMPTKVRASIAVLVRNFVLALPALVIPVLLVAAFLFGIATPTEIGVLSIVYILILIFLVTRSLPWSAVWACIERTAAATASIMLILSTASLYGKVLALEQVPQILTGNILEFTASPLAFLLAVNVLLLVLGCVLDGIAVMVILLPILLPISAQLGIDPVHFGVVVVLNLMIGLITPPFGLALFAITDIAKISTAQMIRSIAPFLVPLFASLLIVTLWADLVLLLPRLMR